MDADLDSAVARAAETIDSGRAFSALQAWRAFA
jgi:anthranilate phosphoribosyltransferase